MKYVKIASLFVVCLLLLGMLTACAQPAAKKKAFNAGAQPDARVAYHWTQHLPIHVRGLVLAGLGLAVAAGLGLDGVSAMLPGGLNRAVTTALAGVVNPNVAAGVLVALWPLAVALPLYAWDRLRWVDRLHTVAAAIALAGVIAVSGSRGAYMAAAAAVLVLLTLRWRRGLFARTHRCHNHGAQELFHVPDRSGCDQGHDRRSGRC